MEENETHPVVVRNVLDDWVEEDVELIEDCYYEYIHMELF